MVKKTLHKKTKRYAVLLAILLAIVAGCVIGQKYLETGMSEELTKIRVPIDMWPGNFWVIIAEKKGFFEEEGLEAELIDVSADYNQLVDDFANKDKDFVDTMNFAVFDLVNKNIEGGDLVAVFVSDSSEGAEGLVAKKEFEKLSDLRGKRIGVEVGSYLDYFLEVAMLNVDIGSNEYTKVDIVTDDILDDFEEKELDAAFSWEPELSAVAAKYDLNKIFDTSYIRGLSPGVFVFKKHFIEENPETVQAVVKVWKKATDYILTNRKETYALISQVDFASDPGKHYSHDEVEELVGQDPLLDLNDNLKAFHFDTGFESLYANIQFVSRFILKLKGLSTVIDTNSMLNDYFIRNISQ